MSLKPKKFSELKIQQDELQKNAKEEKENEHSIAAVYLYCK